MLWTSRPATLAGNEEHPRPTVSEALKLSPVPVVAQALEVILVYVKVEKLLLRGKVIWDLPMSQMTSSEN